MRMTLYSETGQVTMILDGSPQELIEYLKLSLMTGFMPFRIHDKEDKK